MYILSEVWGSNGPAIAVQEGEEYGTIYGWDYVYAYDANGNKRPVLNAEGTEYLKTNQRVPVGNCAPLVTGGINMKYNLGLILGGEALCPPCSPLISFHSV